MSKDILARGGKSATFLPNTSITQEKWDAIFADEPEKIFVSKSQEKRIKIQKENRE
jgi:hypothetical protein